MNEQQSAESAAGHEWKPGDVALVEIGCWANRVVAIRTGAPSNMGWAYSGERDGKSTNNWTADSSGIATPVRPLVVIDPEDREQVERLRDALRTEKAGGYGWQFIQSALRSLNGPEEPKNRYAVVVDAAGQEWVRGREGSWWQVWADGTTTSKKWAQVHAVRVLSEGVADTRRNPPAKGAES